MTRGNGTVTKIFYKGNTDDFVVFVESPEELEQWKKDKSIPLSQVVNSFKVLVTHKHGAQGQLDTASKASLENEFGTANEDEVIKKILEGGQPQSVQVSLPQASIISNFRPWLTWENSRRLVNVAATVTRPWVLDRDILLHREHEREQRCSAHAAWPSNEHYRIIMHERAAGDYADDGGARYSNPSIAMRSLG
jgi:hypothetical protein